MSRGRRSSRWIVMVMVSLTVVPPCAPVAWARYASRPQTWARNGEIVIPKPTGTVEGKVVEVRRISRDVTLQTQHGTLQHVTIPHQASIMAPHGERGLSGIRGGMTVRVFGGVSSQRIVAQKVVARTTTGAGFQGRPASRRVVH